MSQITANDIAFALKPRAEQGPVEPQEPMVIRVGVAIARSGPELDKHRTIQVGISLGTTHTITSDICWPIQDIEFDPETMKTNGITMERLATARAPILAEAYIIDELNKKAEVNNITNFMLMACGWGVGSVAMHWLRHDMPRLYAMFHQRVIDLSSICIILGPEVGSQLMQMCKLNSMFITGETFEHDAGYDAMEAYISTLYLSGKLSVH